MRTFSLILKTVACAVSGSHPLRWSLLRVLGLAAALAFAQILQAGYVPLPKGWQFHVVDLPEINNTRTIIGEYNGAVLMNLSPNPAEVEGQTLFFPVLVNPASHKYAILIDRWPMQWLDSTVPLKGQLSEAQLADMLGKSALAYSLQGKIVSGFYEHMVGKDEDRKVTSWGALGFSIPEDTESVSYVELPRPADSQNEDVIMALYNSQDGMTVFGAADHFYSHYSERRRRFVSALKESNDKVQIPASADYVKYYFWSRTTSSPFRAIRVDFSSDPKTAELLSNDTATLVVVSKSLDGKTIAVNRIPSRPLGSAAADQSVAGIIRLSDTGTTSWSRLPEDAPSRIFTITADGSTCLVAHERFFYKLPVDKVNQDFASPDVDKYRLSGGPQDYFYNHMPDMSVQHIGGTNNVEGGQLISGNGTFVAYRLPGSENSESSESSESNESSESSKREVMFFPIASLLALPFYQNYNNNGTNLESLSFTAVSHHPESASTSYFAPVRADQNIEAGYYQISLPDAPTTVPASAVPAVTTTLLLRDISRQVSATLLLSGLVSSQLTRLNLSQDQQPVARTRSRFKIPKMFKSCLGLSTKH